MPQGHGFRGHGRRQLNSNKTKQFAEEDDETNPLMKDFRGYARELDEKHDRYERIVKMSRDITIESKRIIFLLHSIDGRKNNRERIITEAEERLNNLMANNFKAIAVELDGLDIYQYRGAYSAGLQEFIEAYTFMEYLNYSSAASDSKCMSDFHNLQEKMQYSLPIKEETDKNTETEEESAETEEESAETNDDVAIEEGNKQLVETKQIAFKIIPTEFLLGVADLTGELMRRCINSLGSGETDVCMSTCRVLQQLYSG